MSDRLDNEQWIKEKYDEICASHLGEYCLVSMKIKRFRVFNRLFGREAGNQLIERVHQRVQDYLKEDEYIAHIHLGYFNILMKFSRDYDILFQKIIDFNAFVRDMPGNEDIGKVYMGLGIYKIDDPTIDFYIAQYNADISRVECPEANFRNTHFDIYNQTYFDSNLIDFTLEKTLLPAIENGEIQLYLQPKVDLKTGEVHEAEALVRWIDKERGMIPVNEFLPSLEKTGLIDDMDLYLFEQVCLHIQRFLDEYKKKIKISVNLSQSMFNYRYFFQYYQDIHEKNPCPTECIEFELLESIVLNQVETVKNVVEEIHQYGFSCAIDDFGSGYSSFSVLVNTQLETLKIDRSLFESENEEGKRVIIRHIIETAKELGMKVVAEGVEKQEHLKFLKDLDCDYVQGFVFYKPMPVSEFEERFVKGNEKVEI